MTTTEQSTAQAGIGGERIEQLRAAAEACVNVKQRLRDYCGDNDEHWDNLRMAELDAESALFDPLTAHEILALLSRLAELERTVGAVAFVAEDFVSVDMAHDTPADAVSLMGQMLVASSARLAELERDRERLDWLQSVAGDSHFGTYNVRARIGFDSRKGIRDGIDAERYSEATVIAERMGWYYEPEDGTWRKDGHLQCVDESLVEHLAALAAAPASEGR